MSWIIDGHETMSPEKMTLVTDIGSPGDVWIRLERDLDEGLEMYMSPEMWISVPGESFWHMIDELREEYDGLNAQWANRINGNLE